MGSEGKDGQHLETVEHQNRDRHREIGQPIEVEIVVVRRGAGAPTEAGHVERRNLGLLRQQGRDLFPVLQRRAVARRQAGPVVADPGRGGTEARVRSSGSQAVSAGQNRCQKTTAHARAVGSYLASCSDRWADSNA